MQLDRKMLLILALALVAWGKTSAQPGLPLEYNFSTVAPVLPFFTTSFFIKIDRETPPPLPSSLLQPSTAIPAAYNYEDLGVFCQFEVQLERKFRLPIKVRLGEVNYAEWLEYGYER